ncbi:MAG: TIGR01777 family oxidoreductase [Sandaracinaceae bacterium]
MGNETFVARTRFTAPAERVFDLHTTPQSLPRLTPPFDPMTVVRTDGGIHEGDRTVLRIPVFGPLRVGWTAEHRGYRPPHEFRDVQVKGPFARWEHTHRVEPDGPEACVLTDHIEYKLPFGPLGRLGRGFVQAKLARGFRWRHARMAHDLSLHAHSDTPLRVAMSGASGMLGSALTALLVTGGHTVVPLVRDGRPGGIPWDVRAGELDCRELEGFDAVVHLAGSNIGQRWTPSVREEAMQSRERGTQLIARALGQLKRPPRVFVSMSATGYYGHRSEPVDESAKAGEGFLAEVCQRWEEASRVPGVRVVNPRMGVVLSPTGGALKKMLLPFSVGLGGRLGDGRQGFPWVSIEDAVGALYWMLLEPSLEGPVNVTGPELLDNATFTKRLGHVLRRPTLLPAPAFALRLALGEMADEALLNGVRARPNALTASGYPFMHPTLEPALRHVLGRAAPGEEQADAAPAWERKTEVQPSV